MFSLDGYQAVQKHGGVVRRTDRRVLAVSGGDRASWLQGLVTNDVASLADGDSRYAAYLTPQGRMISDMQVVAQGNRLLLDVPAPLASALRDKLDALIFAEDVQVTDESGDRKSTRLNSSHSQISYAVFCLKKKKKKRQQL